MRARRKRRPLSSVPPRWRWAQCGSPAPAGPAHPNRALIEHGSSRFTESREPSSRSMLAWARPKAGVAVGGRPASPAPATVAQPTRPMEPLASREWSQGGRPAGGPSSGPRGGTTQESSLSPREASARLAPAATVMGSPRLCLQLGKSLYPLSAQPINGTRPAGRERSTPVSVPPAGSFTRSEVAPVWTMWPGQGQGAASRAAPLQLGRASSTNGKGSREKKNPLPPDAKPQI